MFPRLAPLVRVAADEQVGAEVTRSRIAGLIVYGSVALSIAAIVAALIAISWVERLNGQMAEMRAAAPNG